MSSESGEGSVDDTAVDGGIMVELPSLNIDLATVDRSLEEMVSKAAVRVYAPTNHVPTNFWAYGTAGTREDTQTHRQGATVVNLQVRKQPERVNNEERDGKTA